MTLENSLERRTRLVVGLAVLLGILTVVNLILAAYTVLQVARLPQDPPQQPNLAGVEERLGRIDQRLNRLDSRLEQPVNPLATLKKGIEELTGYPAPVTAKKEPVFRFKSLAVLPFPGDSGFPDAELNKLVEKEAATFAPGLSSLLETSSKFQIVPFDAVAKLPTDAEPIKTGRELSADAVLTGSVRGGSSNIRVQVSLVEVKSGFAVWTKEYETNRSASWQTSVRSAMSESATKIVTEIGEFASPKP